MFKNVAAAIFVLALWASVSPVPASALSLDEAKAHGAVGEKPDGYLGVVSGGSSEVSALVETTNKRRREEYSKIAAKNGTPVGVVEKLAGEKAIAKTAKGHFVLGAGGKWQKK